MREEMRVATPTFEPSGGSYKTPQSVMITCDTEGAKIHYTTDGSTPTSVSPQFLGTPLRIASTITLKALGKKNGYKDSEVGTASYVLNLPWTKFKGGTDLDFGRAIAINNTKNFIYVVGSTKSSFDDQINNGGRDIFITKLDYNSNCLWTRFKGGSVNDIPSAVTIDENDNVYITGYTVGAFDAQSNSGSADFFITKYNPDGNWVWTKIKGGSLADYGNSIALDRNRNVYITGNTRSSFDGQSNNGNSDLFVTKYDSNGNWIWTRFKGGAGNESGNSIVVDSDEYVYVTGSTDWTFDDQTNAGSYDMFILKFTP
ncbi:MAG: SBBP repeat-containing protein [Spirochaetes bacterium]|nr:SBBP repeat-containing protein [Spirochaetota bacterium]